MKVYKLYFTSLILILFVSACSHTIGKPDKISNIEILYKPDGSINFIRIKNDSFNTTQEVVYLNTDGTIKKIIRTKDSLYEGQSIWFYTNGNIEKTIIFKNGKANGSVYWFFNDETINNHSYWKNDTPISYATTYYQDSVGTLKSMLYYDSGKVTWRQDFTTPSLLGISSKPPVR